MATLQFLTIVFFAYFSYSVSAYKILVTSLGVSGSQNIQMARLADILAERGHDTTLFWWSLFPTDKVKLKATKEIRTPLIDDQEFLEAAHAGAASIVWKNVPTDLPLGLLYILYNAPMGCESFLKNDKIINQMKAEKYDLIVNHMFDGCTYGLAHVLGVKTVAAFSTAFITDPISWHAGCPAPLSTVPSFTNAETDKMSFIGRLKNVFKTGIVQLAFHVINNKYTDCFRQKYGSNFPSVQSLMKETDLYLLNSDIFFEYPKPNLHNILYVGGLTMEKPDPLDAKWEKIMQNTKPDGVVIFSLGTVTNTSTMPAYIKKALIDGFKRFPSYTFVCKMVGEFPEAKGIENIFVTDWLPQRDLLGHPKVKAFITHGGYNSLMESVYLGVPLIVLPLFGDQPANAKRVERIGVGTIMDKMTLDANQVGKALNLVLKDKKIATNAARISKMIQNKPVSSLELAVKWLEFLAEYKNLDILKPEARHMGIIPYFMLDVFAFLFAVAAIGFYIWYKVCRACLRKVLGKKEKKD